MQEEDRIKNTDTDRIIIMQASEVQQFSGALDVAIRASSNQSVNGKLIWWAGWQLGQLKKYTKEFSDDMSDPMIVELQKASQKKDFDSSQYAGHMGLYDAAMKKECAVKTRVPDESWFDGNLSPAFSKVLSFLELE